MNKDVLDLEWGLQLAGERAEYESQQQFKFRMIQRGDFIKPGWWHWRCRREDATGDVAYGYVLADPLGQTVAPETFEKDHGSAGRQRPRRD